MIRDRLRQILAEHLLRVADRVLDFAERLDPEVYAEATAPDDAADEGAVWPPPDRPPGYRPRRVAQPWMGWHDGPP